MANAGCVDKAFIFDYIGADYSLLLAHFLHFLGGEFLCSFNQRGRKYPRFEVLDILNLWELIRSGDYNVNSKEETLNIGINVQKWFEMEKKTHSFTFNLILACHVRHHLRNESAKQRGRNIEIAKKRHWVGRVNLMMEVQLVSMMTKQSYKCRSNNQIIFFPWIHTINTPT